MSEVERKSKKGETEEERRARKERERAEKKARKKREEAEAAAAAATAATTTTAEVDKRKETKEERRARKDRERAERKAKEAAAAEKKGQQTDQEAVDQDHPPHHHHHQHHTKEEGKKERKTQSPSRRSERDELLAAIEAENTAASRSALHSREGRDADKAREAAKVEEEERDGAERREQRKRGQREERRRKKEKERGPSVAAADGDGADRTEGVAAELRRQGYRGQFEKDMARATALRRLVDLDDAAAVLVDIAPQTEYDMYIRSFTESGKKLVAVQAPDEEDMIDVSVQAERVKTKNKSGQAPDDLGLYPEQYADRVGFVSQGNANADGEEGPANADEARAAGSSSAGRGGVASVDANVLGAFLARVFPVVNAVLDENLAEASDAAAGSGASAAEARANAVSAAAQSFSSACTTYTFPPVRHRPVVKTRFGSASSRCVAALYGPRAVAAAAESTKASSWSVLHEYASVILIWNTFSSTRPERVLVSLAALSCFCFSPSRPHLVYAGAEDGSVCLWDLREPDRHHLSAGRVAGQAITARLPSFSTSWQTDNHTTSVCDVSVAGGGAPSSVPGAAGGTGGPAAAGGGAAEQLVSLDVGGHIKFWAVSDVQSRATGISASEYGLHMFSSVRLTLAATTTAVTPMEFDEADGAGYGPSSGSGSGGGAAAGISDDSDDDDDGSSAVSERRGGAASSLAAGAAGGWSPMPCAGCSSGCSLDFSAVDPSQFVVAAAGGVQHKSRFGLVAAPAVYGGPDSSPYAVSRLLLTSPAAASSTPVPTCVRYSARDSRVILAGYGDGTVRVFLRNDAAPQLTVPVSAGAAAIVEVRAVSSTSWLTWVLDEAGTLSLLDHAHRLQREVPRVVAALSQPETGACLCMDVPSEERTLESGQVALGFEKGVLQVHTVDVRKVLAPAADRDEKWL